MVGWPISTCYARAIQTKNNVQVLNRYIVNDLVVSPLHKTGINVAEWNFSLRSHAGTEGNGMLLCDTYVKGSIGHFLQHKLQ